MIAEQLSGVLNSEKAGWTTPHYGVVQIVWRQANGVMGVNPPDWVFDLHRLSDLMDLEGIHDR